MSDLEPNDPLLEPIVVDLGTDGDLGALDDVDVPSVLDTDFDDMLLDD